MYNTLLTDRALADLRRLDKDTARFIKSKLVEYSNSPFNYAKKLSKSKIGSYRFRVGNYRAIFDINKDDIVILRINHRKDIYK